MLSEIKKRKIVLASVLKPVDDTRMAEKIGSSLSDSGLFTVTIVGFPSSAQANLSNGITALPHKPFKRISLKRFVMPWLILFNIAKLKPDVVIINTPELLLPMVIGRVWLRYELIYDVLENYYRNIRFAPTYPLLIRWPLAALTRLTEILLTPLTTHIFLAEAGYKHELGFARKALVLENKLPKRLVVSTPDRNTRYNLLFTGTLAHTTGIFEAINLCKKLHTIDTRYTLTIIGYCAMPTVLATIKETLKDYSFITLTGGDELVPHDQILKAIRSAGCGIIIYPPNASTENSMPTKLYEYLALKLPIIIDHNQSAHDLIEECKAGIVLKHPIHAESLHDQLMNTTFNFTLPDTLFWEHEAKKMIDILKK